MKNIAIFSILLSCSNFLCAQNDSISITEVNDILNFCQDNIDRDSVVTNLESRFHIRLCALSENLKLYSFHNSLNLTSEEIKSIENHTILITVSFFKQGRPIKIFKEGGVGGGGKIRLEKLKINGISLNSIFLSQTDLKFKNDELEDKLIEIINQKTSDLIGNFKN